MTCVPVCPAPYWYYGRRAVPHNCHTGIRYALPRSLQSSNQQARRLLLQSYGWSVRVSPRVGPVKQEDQPQPHARHPRVARSSIEPGATGSVGGQQPFRSLYLQGVPTGRSASLCFEVSLCDSLNGRRNEEPGSIRFRMMERAARRFFATRFRA